MVLLLQGRVLSAALDKIISRSKKIKENSDAIVIIKILE